MKPYPRVTIGIPTHNRPEQLAAAVASALAQQLPTVVLVADQTGAAADLAKAHAGHPLFRYHRTDATRLWENWTAAAENCDTEFFVWLQDDDLVAPHLSRRVVNAFDRFPTAQVYLARLGLSFCSGQGNWWQSTGPMVPMDLVRGIATPVRGSLIVAGGFFSSWALSPGMAFRWSLEAMEAIRRCPKDCDLYNERIVLAELCTRGDAVCDPAMVGYWVQHDGNESKRQVRAGARGPQYHQLVSHLDRILAGRDDWRDSLKAWAINLGPGVLRDWLVETAEDDAHAPTYDEARAILLDVLKIWIDLEPKKQPGELDHGTVLAGGTADRPRVDGKPTESPSADNQQNRRRNRAKARNA